MIFVPTHQTSGKGLQQGGRVDGPTAPDAKKDEDVYIADYKMDEKQRLAREAFAKRYAEF